MIAEIGAGLSSLKAAFDLAKSLNAGANRAAMNDLRIELQGHILSAQEALAAARDADATSAQRIHDLEKEIVSLKDWQAEKQRYQIRPVAQGAFAYVHKPGKENGEPPQWLCQQCFEQQKISVLQRTDVMSRAGPLGLQVAWLCNSCKGQIFVFYSRTPSDPEG